MGYLDSTPGGSFLHHQLELRRSLTSMPNGLSQQELAKRLGVTQSQVAKMEKRGYESYTLQSLRRYVEALGEEFRLEVKVRRSKQDEGRDFARAAMSR